MSALTVTFVEVDGTTRKIDNVKTGQSLMQLARDNDIAGIYADCGGGCTCATCHVYVDPAWTDIVGPPNALESEMLEMVADIRKDSSRLSCQVELRAELNGLMVTVAPDSFG